MANRLPEPHSPLRAMILKVALWGGIPLAIVGLVVVFENRPAVGAKQRWWRQAHSCSLLSTMAKLIRASRLP